MQGLIFYVVVATDLFLLGLLCLVGLYNRRVASRLQFYHHDLWVELGKPRLFAIHPYAVFVAPFLPAAFVYSKRYRLLGDEQLSRHADRMFNYTIAALAVLCMLLFLPHHRFSGVSSSGAKWTVIV
jgi:hypothetical protein